MCVYSGVVIIVEIFRHARRFVQKLCTVLDLCRCGLTYVRAYRGSTVGCTVVDLCYFGGTYVSVL